MPYKDVLPWMCVVVKYEGKRLLGKILQKTCGAYMVRCLSMPFGVNAPQQSDKDERIYYTEVYQLDVVPYDK